MATSVSFALILPAFGIYSRAPPYRLWLMLAFPLPIYAGMGAVRLLRGEWRKKALALLLIGFTVWLSAGYLTARADNPPEYIKRFPILYTSGYMPSTYLQNVVPVEQTGDLLRALEKAGELAERDGVVVVPRQFAGFAYYALNGSPRVVVTKMVSGDLSPVLKSARERGSIAVYTVWWAEPSGWYGVWELPPELKRVAIEGTFAVYEIEGRFG